MKEKGFTLFIAIVVTATILLVSMGLISLVVRESYIAQTGAQSQYAFFAADTGIECAIYWDVNNPAGFSAFATSSASTITCNKDGSNPGNQYVVGGSGQSVFNITFLPDTYCATVTVTKNNDGTTKIESLGYNTCKSTDPRRVERAVRVTY